MSRLIEFSQFFHGHVPAQYFLMFESPQLVRTMNNPCYGGQSGGDLVAWMRMFLQSSEPMPDEYLDPCTEFGLPALTYFNLVLGRGEHNGIGFKILLPRFDRFPPVSRKEIAVDVLMQLITSGDTPWYSAIRNRLGQNAASAVTEWCHGAG